MSNRLHIQNDYPPDWPDINRRVCESVGHRCIRCGHPYRKGEHGKGEWTPCDSHCTHGGPVRTVDGKTEAQWRILTVHHLDGDKAECSWFNLLALCQRCHLTVQTRLNPEIPYFLEHSDWCKVYIAGFYAKKYEGRNITREEAESRLEELLAYERRI